MNKKLTSQSAFLSLRVLFALSLCSVGAFLAMLSLAATPQLERTRSNIGRASPVSFPGKVGSNASHMPHAAPLPPGAQFSLNRQGVPSLSSLASWVPSEDWSIVSSPSTSPTQNNFLYGLTCFSESDCWAVGYYTNDDGFDQTLIEHWDGTSWSIVSSPNTGATHYNYLYGVECSSDSDCWAVGSFWDPDGPFIIQTLIERWDGTSWAIVSSPNAGEPWNSFYDIKCLSASDCWAVGYYNNHTSIYQTLVAQWDGTSWTIVTSPNTSPTQDNFLSDVTCVSASDCWAAGYYSNDNLVALTLTEHWDGTSWSIVSSPNSTTNFDNYFEDVTCMSASDCWAVGYYCNTTNCFDGAPQTLIEHWDGTSWAIVSSPNTSTTQFN